MIVEICFVFFLQERRNEENGFFFFVFLLTSFLWLKILKMRQQSSTDFRSTKSSMAVDKRTA